MKRRLNCPAYRNYPHSLKPVCDEYHNCEKILCGENPMPRTYLIFDDIGGKLDVLRVECTKCTRKGRYRCTS